ncbi:MAG: cytochrome C oxidase assembly protein, partial [Lapillicoccus sp.]
MTTSRAPGTGRATAPPVRANRGPALLALGVSPAACAVAVAVGGAAIPVVEGLFDVGPVVRWGLPLVRVVQDGAGALTIGLLVVGALFVPGQRTPAVTLHASRYAVVSGVVWVVATVVGVVLGFADAASTPVSDPRLWAQFTQFVWTLETLRVAIISALVAAAATTVAAMSLRRKGIAAAAFLSVAALLPLALTGHASGTANHEAAVNTIAAHLVGASLWVGC